MSRWTSKHLQQLQASGKVTADGGNISDRLGLDDEPAALRHMKAVLIRMEIPFTTEHRFHQVRKFRFDIALLEHRIGIEYEGLMSEKSRHTTLTGYTRDAVKYNLAQVNGWKVLRYTALNYREFESDLLTIIKIP